MITELAPDLQNHEALKDFNGAEDLAKAYIADRAKISAGDISLIPEEIRKDPSLSSFKTVADVAKSFIETKKMVGSIKKAPDTSDGYKFSAPSDLHPGLTQIPESQKVLAGVFHKYGLHNEQADGVQKEIFGLLSNSLRKAEEGRIAKGKEVETALRQEWGNQYDANKSRIENILKRAGAVDLAATVGGDPVALKAMSRITSLLSEDSIGKLGEAPTGQATDKQGAIARIETIKKESREQGMKHPLVDEKNPKHQEAMAEWTKLHELAYS